MDKSSQELYDTILNSRKKDIKMNKSNISLDGLSLSISGDGFVAILLLRSNAEMKLKSFLQSFYYETANIINTITPEQIDMWWESKVADLITRLEDIK